MKRFIKNNLKVFVAMIITTIIVGSVSVYAATTYFAKDISFTPSDNNKDKGFNATNVEEALNELYSLDTVINNLTLVKSGETVGSSNLNGRTINYELNKGKYLIIINEYNTNENTNSNVNITLTNEKNTIKEINKMKSSRALKYSASSTIGIYIVNIEETETIKMSGYDSYNYNDGAAGFQYSIFK